MKLETLTLERYGHFENLSLDLSGDDIRLHIVFGPNETGKSTVLAAVSDLLFGIPPRTPYAFQFDYGQMRVAADVINAAGERLAFKRRKGKGPSGTLLSPQEAGLPDGVLGRFLGPVDRELFERMFGLDHQRLRAGGRKMLETGGDLATSLFEAGSGLTRVTETLRRIQADISALGGLDQRRAAGKPIWQQIDRLTKAQQSIRSDALKTEEWRHAEERLETAREHRRALDEAMVLLRQRRSRLERIRRVGPILFAIDQRVARLSTLSPRTALLPESFEQDWRSLDTAARDASAAAKRAEEALSTLLEEAAAAQHSTGLEVRAAEITSLNEALGDYRQKVADEPKLIRDRAADDSLIAGHLRQLGLAIEPGDVEPYLPPVTLVAKIRELARTGQGFEAAAAGIRREQSEAQDALTTGERKLAALSASMPDPRQAMELLAEVLQLGDVSAELARAEAEHAEAGQNLEEALERLHGWAGTADDLARRSVPGSETVSDFDAAWRRADDARQQAERDVVRATDDLEQTRAEILGLTATGDVPSPAAVRAARLHRDQGWTLIRAQLQGQGRPADQLTTFAADGDLAGSFETALRHADELVDRRESEAQRVLRFGELTAQAERLSAALKGAMAARAWADRSYGVLEASWTALWVESGVVPRSPSAMLGWLRQRDDALRHLAVRRRAGEAVERARKGTDCARKLLVQAAVLLSSPCVSTDELPALLRQVRQAHVSASATWTDRQALAANVEDLKQRVARLSADFAHAHTAQASWRERWSKAVVGIRLQPDASLAEADAALSVWEAIRERTTNRAQTSRRLEGLRRDLETFRAELGTLLESLGPMGTELAATDPESTVRTLHERLREDQRRVDRHAEFVRRAEQARIEHGETLGAIRAAADRIANLLRQYDLEPDAHPLALASEAQEGRQIAAELVEKRNELALAGDGIDEAALRLEASSISPDDSAAELLALERDEERLVGDGQAAAQAETQAQSTLAALAGQKGAAQAAQEAQNASLEIGICAERWMRLEAARRILERAMERYRAANEHPLIRRASEIFQLIAGTGPNPMIRLTARYRDGDAPALVGVRADGSDCEIDGMSEGTRDQLYLALRIATIERYAAENEPLPFLADDLFITSDDERIVPGLAALAELGRTTQVVLFTHHRHVLAAAFGTLPAQAVKVHRLVGVETRECLAAAAR